ncbi:hypothetical protein H072_10137 [Dactylellina haptotyla CBS 200.50]|uniref:DUF7918 domain-containing protein n=1 Tax=Dactylellina haptotyla (strain CBS 200.50) TaxID=1284197 RepID=S8BB54_DACHA|nr:hypothetical protein H072_10137 [Dactylellina haptotyla CBS 200.50]
MPEYKGISCDLYVQESKAKEYSVAHHGSTCVEYVISQEDQLFSFKVNVNPTALGGNSSRLDLELWADGQQLDSFTFTETDYLVDDAQIQDYTGRVKAMKLRFTKINTIEEDLIEAESDQDILRKLGTLEVKIWRAHQDVIQTASLAYQPNLVQNPIYEKSIKGNSVSHCTELTNPYVIAEPSSWGYLTRKIDPYDTPWVTFIFRHASKALLQSGGILRNSVDTAKSTEEMVDRFDSLALERAAKESDSESFVEVELEH